MTIKEYNAMMEAKGTPKVWVVEYGSSTFGSGLVHSSLYLTEEEAKERFDSIPEGSYKAVYETWDIWNFTERQKARRAGK